MATRKPPERPPQAQIDDLERALAGSASLGGTAALARGYLVRGDERWFRETAVALLVEAASRRGLEVSRHDGADPDLDLGALQSDLSAPPMFAGARLVLVRNVGRVLKDDEGDSRGGVERALLSFLRGSAVAGTLVLEAESLRVDHAVAKAVVQAGGPVLSLRKLYDSPPPWERDGDPRSTELVQWLVARARRRSIPLRPDEAAQVAASTGNDLAALDSDLDALARRGERSVRETIGFAGAVSPFQLAEDLVRGDVPAALAGVEKLFRSGMREKDGAREVKPEALLVVLFGSLRSKLRQSVAAARALERDERPEIAGPPRGQQETLARVALRDAETWRHMLDDLVELERGMRTNRRVDASDLALLALRWGREPMQARHAGHAGRAGGAGGAERAGKGAGGP